MNSFGEWLGTQTHREGPVGLLAVSVMLDSEDAPTVETEADLRRRLRAVRATKRWWYALGMAAAEYQAMVVKLVETLGEQSTRLH